MTYYKDLFKKYIFWILVGIVINCLLYLLNIELNNSIEHVIEELRAARLLYVFILISLFIAPFRFALLDYRISINQHIFISTISFWMESMLEYCLQRIIDATTDLFGLAVGFILLENETLHKHN